MTPIFIHKDVKYVAQGQTGNQDKVRIKQQFLLFNFSFTQDLVFSWAINSHIEDLMRIITLF